jgi:hypothetical protein
MKSRTYFVWLSAAAAAAALVAVGWATLAAEEQQGPIDWPRAQQLFQKSKSGQTLTPEEQTYLDRAKAERQKGGAGRAGAGAGQSDVDLQRAKQLRDKMTRGESLTPEEKAYLDRAKQATQKRAGPAAPPPTASTGLVPLDQMTAQDKYKGEDGGLYGGGKNEPPPALQAAAAKEAAKIVPLDAAGKPSPNGKIVLISIGMSNTTQEFSKFKELADAAKSPRVVIVDGAQGGQDAAKWDTEDANTWKVLADRLQAAGVTAEQVQAAWVKHARIQPAGYGEFPKHAEELEGHVIASLDIAKSRFPNLRIAWLSSRIYAGYAAGALNPEPYAYESALVVRRLIQDQAKGEPKLNFDPAKGDVKAPLLLWGPYLWADGTTPRKSDGLVWTREDLGPDGTHPSPASGREKVANLLLKFFKADPSARTWFLAPSAAGQAAAPK